MEQPHAENLSSTGIVQGGSHLAWDKVRGEANNACIRHRKPFKMPGDHASGRSNHLELLCLIVSGRLCKKFYEIHPVAIHLRNWVVFFPSIEEGHLMPDHVHMMIALPPKHAASKMIGFIKGGKHEPD